MYPPFMMSVSSDKLSSFGASAVVAVVATEVAALAMVSCATPVVVLIWSKMDESIVVRFVDFYFLLK